MFVGKGKGENKILKEFECTIIFKISGNTLFYQICFYYFQSVNNFSENFQLKSKKGLKLPNSLNTFSDII